MQRLSELIEEANQMLPPRIRIENMKRDLRIEDIASDSRLVGPKTLFIAHPNGYLYIPDAIKAGATAVLHQEGVQIPMPDHVVRLTTSNTRDAVAVLAKVFFARQPEFIFGITGTDGKTSTADFARQLAELMGEKAASIGTLGLRSSFEHLNKNYPAINTSPDPILLHRTLRQLSDKQVHYVAIEASSHGLDQQRLDCVRFCAGAFTNLTRDHLDYHKTMDAYFSAKARLLDLVDKDGVFVINGDDEYGKKILKYRRQFYSDMRFTTFGYNAEADFRIIRVTPRSTGLEAQVSIRGVHHDLKLPLYGAFQLSNILTAVGLLEAGGFPAEKQIALLPKLRGVPGRLEKIATHNGAPIFIDYAHTPAALENILKTLRPHTEKKLHVVFGCGGDRDAGKRPEMGGAAAKFADHVIVTDDNPRSEDPAKIRAAILAAAPNAQEIPDRDAAIRTAIQQLAIGDVLVIAGKGHETTQTIGNQVLPFSDAEHIRKAVAA